MNILMMINMLDKILQKALKTLFKGQETSNNFIRFKKTLDDLRILKRGDVVIELSDGPKVILTMRKQK